MASNRGLVSLEFELVVIEQLPAGGNVAFGDDKDAFHAVHAGDTGVAVGVARVVDETRQASL